MRQKEAGVGKERDLPDHKKGKVKLISKAEHTIVISSQSLQ